MWEDHEVDRRALAIGPGARVVVVAGAGDRALDAVAWGAGEVVAVDLNPSQLRLCALKVAAASTLDTTDLVALFSAGRRPGVRRLYRERLRPRLDPTEQRYWDRYIDVFEMGLHRHHPVGFALWLLSLSLRAIGGRELRHLIAAAPDATTQARWYERRLRWRYWNRPTRWLMRQTALLRLVVVHAGERDSMRSQSFHEWLEARISRSVEVTLIRENPYWMGLLSGHPVTPEHEETWLRPDSVGRLSRAREIIHLEQGSIVDYLEARAPGSVDAVGLSNVPDWLGAADLERLWSGLASALVPGGRAVLRSAYRTAPLPTGPAAVLLRLDRELSETSSDLEQTGIYASVSVLHRALDSAPARAGGTP